MLWITFWIVSLLYLLAYSSSHGVISNFELIHLKMRPWDNKSTTLNSTIINAPSRKLNAFYIWKKLLSQTWFDHFLCFSVTLLNMIFNFNKCFFYILTARRALHFHLKYFSTNVFSCLQVVSSSARKQATEKNELSPKIELLSFIYFIKTILNRTVKINKRF